MTRPALRRWLTRIGILVLVLVALIIAGLWWLVGTQAGLHFALDRVTAASNGALRVESANGRLAGPLHLQDIRYRNADGSLEARVHTLDADLSLWALLRARLHLTHLRVAGVEANLTTPATPAPKSDTAFSLQPPVAIVVDSAHISDIHVRKNGQPVFRATTLDVAGAWTAQDLRLQQLKLRSPDGRVDLSGQLALASPWQGEGSVQFHWTLDDTTYVGTVDSHNDGDQARLALALSQPMVANIEVTGQPRGKLPWTATIKVPEFDPQRLLGDSSVNHLAVTLRGHGDRKGGTLAGTIALNRIPFELKPLALRYDAEKQRVDLEQLVLTSPKMAGTLQGHGTLDLGADPMHADLAIHWHDVLLPASLAGQELASAGDLSINGDTQTYHVQGKMQLGPPGKLAHMTLNLDGSSERVALNTLAVVQPDGKLNLSGTFGLGPEHAFTLAATGKHFDPGLILSDWNGALNLVLDAHGTLADNEPDATFVLKRLEGHLRQRPVSGHGQMHLGPNRVLNGTLALASGHSHITLEAHGTQTNHATAKFDVATLNDWLPDAGGSVHGTIHATGKWPKLSLAARLHSRKLALHDYQIGTAELNADIPDLSHPGGTVALQAGNITIGSMHFKSINLDGHGSAAQHSLELAATGEPLSLHMALTGTMQGKAWKGTLSRLDLDLAQLPPWRLQAPAQLGWNQGQASLSRLCLNAGAPSVCVSADKARNGALDAQYQLQQLPLALIATVAGQGLPLRAEGSIDGNGTIHRSAAGALQGEAHLTSAAGSIAYPDRPELPLLAYRDFQAHATLAPNRKHVTLSTHLDRGGHIQGAADVNGPQQALSGHLEMHMDSLAPIELFTSALADIHGNLDAQLLLGGTIEQPAVTGHAHVRAFAAELPALGLKLHDGDVRVATANDGQVQLDGHIRSGKGVLKLGGTLGTGTGGGLHLSIDGEQVLAADIPAARVTVSPHLAVERNDKGLDVSGKLAVDKALVELEKLPGAGATKASPDVVVVDDDEAEKQSSGMAVRADVAVDLGHQTHLIGYGLDGHVSGLLNVHQAPGKPATGRGQIVINGTYKAYGQDLHIKQGHLLFASTPVDNPGLDIRAVRQLHPNATINDNEVVGLQISGTAQRPSITVFSNPVMDQSDALSYLITGKPLSSVKGGEGNLVNAAAQALGSATGDLLAKGIGSRLGIDAGVSSSEALGTAAFTVGKYLSPRLYLSYGVGLFDPGQVITLRYILSRRWNFEAEQATDFSRASFNYRLER